MMEETVECSVKIVATFYMAKTWLVALYDRHVVSYFVRGRSG